jgi:acetyl esterase/lipase
MAINAAMRLALKALSYPDLDTKNTYKLQRQLEVAAHPYLKPLFAMWDHAVAVGGHTVPVRVFLPARDLVPPKILLFFHGGGWVVGNIDSYTTICAAMARLTRHIVVSVDYRLAPEFRFPVGLEDCYAVARELFELSYVFQVEPEHITLIGDSAGGNLAAAVSLMARDRGEFRPRRQILLYPAVSSDHGPASPWPSVRECGTDYLLTAKKINDFMDLYKGSDADLANPYLAPILAPDLSGQPDTLIVAAQYDPLRDEAAAYAERLRAAGNRCDYLCLDDALHGFLALPERFVHVRRCYEAINTFLDCSEEGKCEAE